MPGNPRNVTAVSPDGTGVSVGPVYSEEAALALALEIRAAGWTPDGVKVHMSAAAFRAFVKDQAAAAAGEDGTDD